MTDGGEPYDTGAWVDVGRDGRWRPSPGERLRSLIVLAVAATVLLVLAALASVDDGDGADIAAATTTTSPSTTAVTTTTATTVIDATSVGGQDPPLACVFDDRGGAALRAPSETSVLVLNGTPRGGHAGEVTTRLRAAGYDTIVPGNAALQGRTSVEYTTGHCAEAVALLGALGVDGAEIAAVPEGSNVFLGRAEILVTLGRDSL